MSTRRKYRPLLREIAPDFAEELAGGLRAEEEPALADQVPGLRVLSLCGCGDLQCATFTTRGGTDRGLDQQVETIPLDSLRGIVNVDVVEGRIVQVEALYRSDLRSVLEAGFPRGRAPGIAGR